MEADPSFWNDSQKASAILKEKKQIELTLIPYLEIKASIEDAGAMLELCQEMGGVDEASREELIAFYRKSTDSLRKLEFARMLSGELDGGDAYLVINAGAGGTEACDWAGILARMYTRYAQHRGFDTKIIDFTDGDGAGYRSVTFEICGAFAYGFLKAEVGVHRLVRISPFDSNARRHTSFASIFVYPIVEDDIAVEVNTEDLRVDTYRASGAGGQHVNKTESAVRMTHLPTGIVVQCQAERSQIQNREKCMKMLKARLYELELQKKQEAADKMHAEKKQIAWGSQIRNYVLQPYQMVKDVRTGMESSAVDKVLDGDIQPFIERFLLKQAEN